MIFRNILSTILYGLFRVTFKKKKNHHYIKVYFKFVCPAFDHLSPAFTALPKDFKNLAAMQGGIHDRLKSADIAPLHFSKEDPLITIP